MLPDLSILLALLVGLSTLYEAPVAPLPALLGTAASVCVAIALTWMNADRGVKAIRRGDTALRELRWPTQWAVIAWLVASFHFDWGALVGSTIPRTWWLGRYAVLFVPVALMWCFAWAMQGRMEQALGEVMGAVTTRGSPRESVRQGIRRNGIALIPLFLLVGIFDGIWLLGEWGVPGLGTASRWMEALPLLSIAVMLGLVAGLTLFLPLILRKMFSTESLPQGRIRQLLEEQAARIGLRYNDIVVWKTRHRMLNAMVVGFTPGTRTIFMTDGLLSSLPEDEILAVFCHEAGHAKKYHLPLFLLLFATTALCFRVIEDVFLAYDLDPIPVVIAHLAFLWFVLLGTISRLLEREADLYGSDHAADLEPAAESIYVPGLKAPLPAGAARMIRALQRVGQMSGRTRSHRHGSIEERVQFLATHATDPSVRTDFTVRKRRLLLVTLAATVLAVGAALWRLPSELTYARAELAFQGAYESYEESLVLQKEDEAEAKRRWTAAYAGFDATVRTLGGAQEPRARGLRVTALYNRADTALHGLRDEAQARRDYDVLLETLEREAVPAPVRRTLAFAAHVDRGRILAHQGALEASAEDLERASAQVPAAEGEDGAYFRARLALLKGALRVAAGDEKGAREHLEGHVLRVSGQEGSRWQELGRDARLELERLPPKEGP